MSQFKRFISYMYEYRQSQKGTNRGFLKVECRNGICKFLFSLNRLCENSDDRIKVYAFTRKGALLQGSLLADTSVRNGQLQISLEMPEAEIGELHYPFETVSGIILMWKPDILYATQWDDFPMNFEGFPNTSLPSLQEASPSTDTAEILPDSTAEESETADSPVENIGAAPEVSDEEIIPPADLEATDTKESSLYSSCFGDGALINCRRITPKDICRLHPSDQHLSNNRFVHYGYQAFGHLLVGELAETHQNVFCVPGSYYQQECFMANMFGFPHFIRCPGQKQASHCFGYWYRPICNLPSEPTETPCCV